MLGEKRNKSAFYGALDESVRGEPMSFVGRDTEVTVTEDFMNGKSTAVIPVDEEWRTREGSAFQEAVSAKPEYASNPPAPRKEEPGETGALEDFADDEEPSMRQPEISRILRTHDLFFSAADKARDFTSVLREVQEYLSKEYSSLVTGDGTDEVKAQIRRFAGKYIQDYRIAVEGMTTDELIEGIYSEMAEFGFLTKYIYGEGIEEIDGATRS